MVKPNDLVSLAINSNILDDKSSEELIFLSDLTSNKLVIPDGYTVISLKFDDYTKIKPFAESVATKFAKKGYNPNLFVGLYEATLNAYQHGNKSDSDKEITFAYNDNGSVLDLIVEDSCTVVKKPFINYLSAFNKDTSNNFKNFYDSSNEKKSAENHGVGISFIHTYFDEVNYFVGEQGVLLNLKKNKG